jgi:Transposase zinc-binding domain
MARCGLEVADVFRRYGKVYREEHGASLSTEQRRVMSAIELCRTAALGGHVEQCDHCGHQRISYNSCIMGKFRNGELAVGSTPKWWLFERTYADQFTFALHYNG